MDKKKSKKPKKPRRFVVDVNGDPRLISRNESHPDQCVRNCKSIYRANGQMYCSFCNSYVHASGKKLFRNIRCKNAEKTVDQLCSEDCGCKTCKDVLYCCAFNKELCKDYRINAYLCQQYKEI